MNEQIAEDIAGKTGLGDRRVRRELSHDVHRTAGGIIDDLIVYFMTETWFRLVVNAGTAENDIRWMKEQAATRAPNLEITPRPDLAMVAVQGPQAAAKLWLAMPGLQEFTENLKPFNAVEMGAMFVARTGYTGEDTLKLFCRSRQRHFSGSR